MCCAYSYGSLRASQKEYLQQSKFPILMKTALFAQDVISSPLMFPIYLYTDLKFEQDNMHNFLTNSRHNQQDVHQVRKELLHLPWSSENGCNRQVLHYQTGEGFDIT